MNLLKLQVAIVILLATVGCATHAKIDMPVISKVNSTKWQGKTFRYEVFYSQPKPGVFSSGEQEELKPLSEATLSVGSAQVMTILPQILADQLPVNTVLTDSEKADYRLRVEMVAHHKLGPAYPDYKTGKNLAKGLLTLGMGADEYDIVADFDVKYSLTSKEGKEFEKEFTVNDSIEHERSSIEFKNNTFDYASELLRKHIMVTSSAFLKEASQQL